MMEKVYQRPYGTMPVMSGYCPGCLHTLATKLIAEAVEALGQNDNALHVLPVGCAALGLMYWRGDMVGAAHGRAPAVATGVKRCCPERLVFTYQGDGDLAAIGLAEIIAAANRGEQFTVIFANNSTYGMTGGQMAPTTLIGQKSTTSLQGRDPQTTGYPMKMSELIAALEAPCFVARHALDNPKHIRAARKGIQKAFELQLAHKGFTFVELLTNCPTNWGMSPLDSLRFMEEHTIPAYPLGVFKDTSGLKGE